MVLIETLWNVNIRRVRDLAFLKSYYINRSIVECKETSFQKYKGSKRPIFLSINSSILEQKIPSALGILCQHLRG